MTIENGGLELPMKKTKAKTNPELGHHYQFCDFRVDALGHTMRGLLLGGTDWQGKEAWEFLVLLDDHVCVRTSCPDLKEARRTAWNFQHGHLHNLIDEWTAQTRRQP